MLIINKGGNVFKFFRNFIAINFNFNSAINLFSIVNCLRRNDMFIYRIDDFTNGFMICNNMGNLKDFLLIDRTIEIILDQFRFANYFIIVDLFLRCSNIKLDNRVASFRRNLLLWRSTFILDRFSNFSHHLMISINGDISIDACNLLGGSIVIILE